MPAADQPRIVEGSLDARGLRVAIVVSRFNGFVTERLLDGAVDTLVRSGASPEDVTVYRTPGAFEIPSVVARVLETDAHDAVIALGCLMRGDTIHFDLIASEVSKGLAELGRRVPIPVAFGVITPNTLEQAIDRAGAKAGNKGAEAAQAAVEQCRLYRAIGAAGRKPASRSRRKKR